MFAHHSLGPDLSGQVIVVVHACYRCRAGEGHDGEGGDQGRVG
jgi:hypothetical protein